MNANAKGAGPPVIRMSPQNKRANIENRWGYVCLGLKSPLTITNRQLYLTPRCDTIFRLRVLETALGGIQGKISDQSHCT
jgi:hypothetical protein